MSNFMVAMKAVTYQLCLKFPTPRCIEVVRGNQYEVQTCYTTSFRSAPTDSSGKRTAGKAGLVDGETLTIRVLEARCELDPRLLTQ